MIHSHRRRSGFRDFGTRKAFLLALACLFLHPAIIKAEDKDADQSAPPDPLLTVERIYDSSEFASQSFAGKWIGGEKQRARYVVSETVDGHPGKCLVRYDAATGNEEILVSGRDLIPTDRSEPLLVSDFAFTRDMSKVLIFTNTRRVWRAKTRGDYWVLDRATAQLTKLGGDADEASLMYAKFSPKGNAVAYVRDGDIYIETLLDGVVRRVTQKSGPRILNGMSDWVYEEEFRLRDGFQFSPDGSRIAYWQFDTSGVGDFTMINNTDSRYPTTKVFAYPKAGTRNSAVSLLVVDLASGTHRKIQMPGNPRQNYLPRAQWVEKTGELLVRQMNRLQNTETLTLVDFETLTKRVIFSETDPSWIDLQPEVYFLSDAESFVYLSDRNDWRQLFKVDVASGEMDCVTPGNYDVIELIGLFPSGEQELAYFIASPDSAIDRFLYSVNLATGEVRRVTPDGAEGVHTYQISANGNFAIHQYSTTENPPVYELVALPSHRSVRVLEPNEKLNALLDQLKLPEFKFLRVDIGDTELDGWSVMPEATVQHAKTPLLFHVYGEPAGSTVMNRWMGSSGLWHRMLAQKGIAVMSFDNRGTKVPRGREFRKAVYRQVAHLGPNDQAKAVKKVLEENPNLDADRVGIWGWSGGGTSTLHAMFRHGDVFKAGLAVAPVANLAYYDTIYQERYMGLPSGNVQGYRKGSAIHFADQLTGKLMLIHGTADDNVHYQASELLVNRLIELNKQFEFFVYPNRSHSVSEGRGTAMHLRTMMTDYLERQLLKNGPS
ncbi:MAG: S9 family peptidase [Planctomycetota bacterium]